MGKLNGIYAECDDNGPRPHFVVCAVCAVCALNEFRKISSELRIAENAFAHSHSHSHTRHTNHAIHPIHSFI